MGLWADKPCPLFVSCDATVALEDTSPNLQLLDVLQDFRMGNLALANNTSHRKRLMVFWCFGSERRYVAHAFFEDATISQLASSNALKAFADCSATDALTFLDLSSWRELEPEDRVWDLPNYSNDTPAVLISVPSIGRLLHFLSHSVS